MKRNQDLSDEEIKSGASAAGDDKTSGVKQNGYNDYSAKPEEIKKQFHPAFCAAMELELREDREHLVFEKEYNLNTKPNRMDLLVINADTNVKVKSELGAIFRKHNIFEYKSPKDTLDVKIYHRTVGYAYLYVAYGKDISSMEEITVSFLRAGYPRALMKWLQDNHFTIEKYANGIYHVTKTDHVDMQIIAANQLGNGYAWINKLTPDLNLEDIKQMQMELRHLRHEEDWINAESVMDLSLSLNAKKEWVKELNKMGVLKDMLNEERKKMRVEWEKEHEKIQKEQEEYRKQHEEYQKQHEEYQKQHEEYQKQHEEYQKQLKSMDEQLQSKDEQLQSKDEQLQSKDEQLQSKDEQLQSKDEQLQSKDEQLQSKDEQLQNKEKQLKSEQEENTKLRKEIEELKKQIKDQMGRIAMF